MAFSFQGDRLKEALEKLTTNLKNPLLYSCDVTSDSDLDSLFAQVAELGKLDFVVHSVADARATTFEKPFHQTTREEWKTAMDVSAYSLVAVSTRAAPLMTDGGSITTLTYLAATLVPHYNMMGVAKAALEASVRYLAYDLGRQKIRVNAISAWAFTHHCCSQYFWIWGYVFSSWKFVYAKAQHHSRRSGWART